MDTLTNDAAQEQPEEGQRAYRRAGLQRFFLHRHFALLWSGQTVSAFGSYITGIGLPMAALLLLHASPAQMGLLTALGALPGLLAGLFIGVWVDRLPRRPVLILSDLARAMLLGLIPLVFFAGILSLSWFYIVTVLVGLLTVSFDVASLAFLPTLLAPDELATGNSRLGTSSSVAEIGGPPMASVLVQLLTAPIAILLDALSFLFSAVCISLIRIPEHPRPISTETRHFWREMREGLSALFGNPVLRAMAAYICSHNFFGGSFAALYLLYTVQLFGNTPFVYSISVAFGGVGALVGSFTAGFFARRFGYGKTMLVSALVFDTLALSAPLAMGPAPLILLMLAVPQLIGDAGFAIYSINEISLRQEIVPEHLLGRINSCMHILSNGIMPVGALLAGLLSERIGIRLTLLIGATGIALSTGWLYFSPLRRVR